MVKLVNRAKMKVASGGAGVLTLGQACDGYQSFAAAGVTDQNKLRYTITDGDNWEIGIGTYTASGTTLARAPTESSNSGNAITCGSGAEIFVTMSAEDFSDNAAPVFVNSIPSTLALTPSGVSTIDGKALDDDGFPVSYSFDGHTGNTVYSASSLPPQLSAVSIDQTTGVFSLTATNSASGSGSHFFRVRASDGVRTSTRSVSCSLSFLPTAGLLGFYDMKDSNSYAGTGTAWADVSGNSGPNLVIDTNSVTYNSSGIGSIPSLSLDTAVANGPVYYQGTALSNSSNQATVAMIFAKKDVPSQQSEWRMFGHGVVNSKLITPDGTYRIYPAVFTSGSASTTSSGSSSTTIYIDKVDATAYQTGPQWDALNDTNNVGKYHSVVVTDMWTLNGWFFSRASSGTKSAFGELRALLFYDRTLSSSEVTQLHTHFAADYSSSEMIQ